ncbi:MAG: hypothetical protein EZS28_044005, partial [Streblomastix strix]
YDAQGQRYKNTNRQFDNTDWQIAIAVTLTSIQSIEAKTTSPNSG